MVHHLARRFAARFSRKRSSLGRQDISAPQGLSWSLMSQWETQGKSWSPHPVWPHGTTLTPDAFAGVAQGQGRVFVSVMMEADP